MKGVEQRETGGKGGYMTGEREERQGREKREEKKRMTIRSM